MRIGIIGFCNLSIMQYLYKYTNILDSENVEYDVVYWNRLGIEEKVEFKGKAVAYDFPINTYQSFYKKILLFLKYASFARKSIRKNKYDKLIILTTQTAFILSDLLCGKYKSRYIFDFRDITKENKIWLYKKLVHKIIGRSECTMMSSSGFVSEIGLIDTSKVQIAHNTQTSKKSSRVAKVNTNAAPIKVVFWGIVRQLEHNKKVCDCFGNDKRFWVVYNGTGAYEELETYCREKGYTNIVFTGVYNQPQIAGFVEKTDILMCIYENDDEQKPAMPVKAYDAIRFRLPVLINKNCQLEEFFAKTSGALGVDVDSKDAAEQIYAWYKKLDETQVESDYRMIEAAVIADDKAFEKKLMEFIR